jgi:hypothetical protein
MILVIELKLSCREGAPCLPPFALRIQQAGGRVCLDGGEGGSKCRSGMTTGGAVVWNGGGVALGGNTNRELSDHSAGQN